MEDKGKDKVVEAMAKLREDFKKYHPNETPEEWAENMKKSIQAIDRRAKRTKAALQRKEEELLKKQRGSKEYAKTFSREEPEYRLSRLTPKSVEEIVASGTGEEVGYLNAITYIGNMDRKKELASVESCNASVDRLSQKEHKKAQDIFASMIALKTYELNFLRDLLIFQKDAAFLARYVVEWREMERQAQELTTIYQKQKEWLYSKASGTPKAGLFAKANLVTGSISTIKFHEAAGYEGLIKKLLLKEAHLRDKCTLHFDGKTDSFKVDIGSEEDANSLKRKLRMRAAYLQESTRTLKEQVEAIYLFLKNHKLPEEAITFAMEVYIENTKEEGYLRTLGLGVEYFRSTINERIAEGDEPTEEDIERAVFPDYYEVVPLKANIERFLREIEAGIVEPY